MTEWPPQALASLHGRLWTVRYRSIIAMLLCAPAIIWSLLPISTIASPSQQAIRIVLGWGVVIGLIFYLRAIILAAGLFDSAVRARAGGNRSSLILETALDRSTDTAALIHASGMYDIVLDRTRTRVRSLRTLASALQVLSGLLMLPLFCLALVLALHGAADIIAFLLIPVLPFVFLNATSAVSRAYAAILIHWDRGSEAWDPRPESDAERDARVTSARFSLGTFAASAAAGLAAVALFVCIAAVIAVVLGTSTVMRYRRGFYITRPVAERMVAVEYMRTLRMPPDSTLTAQQAGIAFHSLLYPMGDVAPGMRPPVVRYDRFLWPHDVPYSSARDLWNLILDGKVDATLLSPARESFDSLLRRPSHPALAQMAVLARAVDLDVTATRYDESIGQSNTRIGSGLFVGRDLWLGATTDAALRFERGDSNGAELRLREMISAGFLLIDRSPYETDLETGVELVNAGREGLRVVFERTGRSEAATTLLEITRAARRATRGLDSDGARPQPLERDLWQIAGNDGAYPAVRWSAFQVAVPATRCGGLQTVMFGLSPREQARVDTAAASIVRIPSDSVLVRAVLTGARFDPRSASRRPGIRRLLRLAGLIVGDRLLDSPCLGAFTTRF